MEQREYEFSTYCWGVADDATVTSCSSAAEYRDVAQPLARRAESPKGTAAAAAAAAGAAAPTCYP